MPVVVPALELLDLADALGAAASPAREAVPRLGVAGGCAVGAVQPAADHFLDVVEQAVTGLAVELDVLGRSVQAAAASWLALDAELLARGGTVRAR